MEYSQKLVVLLTAIVLESYEAPVAGTGRRVDEREVFFLLQSTSHVAHFLRRALRSPDVSGRRKVAVVTAYQMETDPLYGEVGEQERKRSVRNELLRKGMTIIYVPVCSEYCK